MAIDAPLFRETLISALVVKINTVTPKAPA
jgi:hypothetical protein